MEVFDTKFLFNSGVSFADGDDLYKRVVKSRIQVIVANENAAVPLSDQEIANILKIEGVTLARRTVTRYREDLDTKFARFRKRQFEICGIVNLVN